MTTDTASIVIVTGAAGAIGRAISNAFSSRGWYVIGVDRTDRPADLDIDEFIRADLASAGGVVGIETALAHLDRVDALVNNAAVQVNRALVDTTDDEWELVMDTNVRAAFRMIRAFHAALATTRGAIVNIGSVHAIATSPNVAAYAISKGALAALTRTAALELAGDGIRCNAVLPGAVMTPMLLDGLSRRPHEHGAQGSLDGLVARTPLGFVATPDQIAPTVVHLADRDASPYTTGQLIVVDGGATLRLGTE